jgi:hypothetical protein
MLTQRSIETLIDLAENKLSQIIPFDREDVREIKLLQSCVDDLKASGTAAAPVADRRAARLENRTATH